MALISLNYIITIIIYGPFVREYFQKNMPRDMKDREVKKIGNYLPICFIMYIFEIENGSIINYK